MPYEASALTSETGKSNNVICVLWLLNSESSNPWYLSFFPPLLSFISPHPADPKHITPAEKKKKVFLFTTSLNPRVISQTILYWFILSRLVYLTEVKDNIQFPLQVTSFIGYKGFPVTCLPCLSKHKSFLMSHSNTFFACMCFFVSWTSAPLRELYPLLPYPQRVVHSSLTYFCRCTSRGVTLSLRMAADIWREATMLQTYWVLCTNSSGD